MSSFSKVAMWPASLQQAALRPCQRIAGRTILCMLGCCCSRSSLRATARSGGACEHAAMATCALLDQVSDPCSSLKHMLRLPTQVKARRRCSHALHPQMHDKAGTRRAHNPAFPNAAVWLRYYPHATWLLRLPQML